nr:immunoglobulin heavy chain junction region [Macaca mulatta]MOX62763.1 immunoglobulin heavy chain junction region [Macaca mulatta]MOX62793.1 immunoglobulin heavy chain junction region [Macaca mulatta]MOX63577.1 immunoglobulin heavy chain junction region [Macaca mulatta]MOX64041.1 immunoglobulin heavy chain junction region [Macaca mulatta]
CARWSAANFDLW